MIPRPWTRTGRFVATVQLAAVAALTLLAPVLLPTAPFAHETGRATSATPLSPRAKPPVELEGTLDILHEDRDDGTSHYHHALATDDGTRVSLEGVTLGLDLLTGDRVRVTGTRSAAALRLQAATASGAAALEVLAAAPLSNTFGPQKTLLILVNFSDNPAQPYTVAQAQSGYAALDAWFREVSYQQTSLTIDVVGWYTLSLSTAGCDTSLLQSKARQAAAAAGVNLASYVRQVYAFPFNTNCKFAGMASVGGTPSSVWINGNANTGLLAHEFGHTLGLYHSHALKCHPSVLTPPCSALVRIRRYHRLHGRRQRSLQRLPKAAARLARLQPLPPITAVSTSGTYALDAYELPGTAPKALKIARGTTGQSFFVELRRPVGWDAGLYLTGVFIHLASVSQPDSSTLLDMTPNTSSMSDTFLGVGKSFTDPVSGITLTTLSVSSTTATIQVDTRLLHPLHPLGARRHRHARPEPRRLARHRRDLHRLRHQYRHRRLHRRHLRAPGDAAQHELVQDLRRLQPHPEPRRDRVHDAAHHVPRRAPRLLPHRHHRDQHHRLDALRLDLGRLQRHLGHPTAATVHGHLQSPRFTHARQRLGGDDRQPDDPVRRGAQPADRDLQPGRAARPGGPDTVSGGELRLDQ